MDLVTGGLGFIGGHLVERLLTEGRRVRVLDNAGPARRAAAPAFMAAAEVIAGDVRDPDAVARAMTGVEAVYHLAAEASVPKSIAEPELTYAVNVTGTLTVFHAAAKVGVRRVVFASSSAVYGDAPVLPKVETLPPDPRSPYASSKLAGEDLCRVFSAAYGLEAVALRFFNVYGPRQDPRSAYAAVIPRFLAALAAGEQPVVYGDGEQSRDFIFVADVVEANRRAAEAPGASGRVFNVAGGRAITLNALLRLVGEALGVEATARYEADRPGDVRHSLAGVEAAKAGLGFAAEVPFAEGLRLTAAAMTGAIPAGVA